LLPAITPEALGALERRLFGAEGDAVAKLYNGADAESANFAEDRMLSDYVFAASRRGADAFAAQSAPVYIYRFTRFAPGLNKPKSARSL
jgi:carboxylesterase type B